MVGLLHSLMKYPRYCVSNWLPSKGYRKHSKLIITVRTLIVIERRKMNEIVSTVVMTISSNRVYKVELAHRNLKN